MQYCQQVNKASCVALLLSDACVNVGHSLAACVGCSGQIGFLLCTKKGSESADPRTPKREPSAKPSKDYPALRYFPLLFELYAFGSTCSRLLVLV